MRKSLNAAAVVAALGIMATASAQTNEDLYPYGLTLRGGVALPIDRSLTNVANALVNIGGEFDLRRPLLSNGDTYVSADYFFKGFGGNGNGHVIPIMLNQRVYTSLSENQRSYFFFGVGVAFVNVNGNGTALAARGGVGQELGPRVIAEIGAYLSDRAGGARANAITFNLGYRF